MRKTLLASTCLAAMAAMPLHAETTIDSATTAPVSTSTVKAGAPDDIKITKDGSIKPTGGTAVTIDSDHKVVNDGTLQIGNANGATGIFAEADVTGSITNTATGKIVIDASYEGEEIEKDGDQDGTYAVDTGRAGIAPGGGFPGATAHTASNIGATTWRDRR